MDLCPSMNRSTNGGFFHRYTATTRYWSRKVPEYYVIHHTYNLISRISVFFAYLPYLTSSIHFGSQAEKFENAVRALQEVSKKKLGDFLPQKMGDTSGEVRI